MIGLISASTNNSYTGSYEITLSDGAVTYFTSMMQDTGLTKDEIVSRAAQRLLEEKYNDYLKNRVEEKLSSIDSSNIQLGRIIALCTNIDIVDIQYRQPQEIEEVLFWQEQPEPEEVEFDQDWVRNELKQRMYDRLESATNPQIENFIQCVKDNK